MYKNHEIVIDNVKLLIRDLLHSCTVPIVERELNEGDYNLSNIDFKKGDCVVDVGANVGTTAIYLARKHPYITVYAYEPVWENFVNLVHNRYMNQAWNVHCIHGAVGKTYGLTNVVINTGNTGGSYTQEGYEYVQYSLTEILEQMKKRHGAENEIFKRDYAHLAEYLSIETHGTLCKAAWENIEKFEDCLWIKKA
jgi:FkbM family methyltransferase